MALEVSKTKREFPDEEERDGESVQVLAHAGPLPHPALLEAYDRIVPGGAERIFKQFEEQSAHRQAMEMTVIRSNSFVQVFGSISAFVLGLVGICRWTLPGDVRQKCGGTLRLSGRFDFSSWCVCLWKEDPRGGAQGKAK